MINLTVHLSFRDLLCYRVAMLCAKQIVTERIPNLNREIQSRSDAIGEFTRSNFKRTNRFCDSTD